MRHPTFRRILAGTLGAPVFGLMLVMLAPLQATPVAFLYDLALHIALGAIGVMIVAAVARMQIVVFLAAALLIAAAWPVAVAQFRAPAMLPAGHDAQPVRLFWANLYHDNLDVPAFERTRAAARPDITAVTELPRAPFTIAPKAASTGGRESLDSMLASELPVSGVTVRHRGGRDLPVIAVDYTLPDAGGTLRVVALHAANPVIGPWPSSARDLGLDAAIALVKDAPERGKVILTGDFNLTPWAPSFRRLLAEADLRTTTPRGLPIMTWPSWLLWAGIPIDHVLVGSAVGVGSLTRGPDIGSDHRPLIAELLVSRQVQVSLGSSSGTNSTTNPAAVATR